ncbi:cell division protein FtsA [Occallatibacter savannae]|uniref:cell division protein FtsA n=1 Tax=Occallatibacter savannae TaxID=1002691 RepID=UPI000D6937DE|nr:cell division protein FtsA [Occallatibacter savannae]
MNETQDNLIVVLDVGSAWTRVLAADVNEGALRYRGHGVVESAGMRKGLISDLGPAAKAVKAANEAAEWAARANIDEIVVGIGGPHIRGLNTNGGLDLGSRMREITREDVRAAVERARAVERPPDREILHLLPRQFILDDQPGIFDPVGMVGARLEVDLHIATCSGSALQSVVTCANRAGLEVSEAVLESIAAAESTLSADERELGVCLLDIGAHSSDLVVFFEGAVAHTASVPVGGNHFTNDLAVGLQMPTAQAEELKRQYGHAVVTAVPIEAEIEINNPEPQRLALRTLAEILEPRARELLYFVKESLRSGGVLEALGAGCVLTGGGAMLPGLLDVTESQLRVPARTGNPVRLSNMPGELVTPSFSTAIGMLLYAHRTRVTRAAENNGLRAKLRAIFAASF